MATTKKLIQAAAGVSTGSGSGGGGGGSGSSTLDISGVSYASKSYDVSTQATFPSSIDFNAAGTKMIIGDYSARTFFTYSLSTAWDASTASYDGSSASLVLATGLGNPLVSCFGDDGRKLYSGDHNNAKLHQHTLSTAYDVSTASSDSKSLHVFSVNEMLRGPAFSSDGTKLYVAGAKWTLYDDRPTINQWDLTTAWDISTASFANKSLSIENEIYSYTSGNSYDLGSIHFNSSGTQVFLQDAAGNDLYQYDLTTAWDISTASYANKTFDLSNQTGYPRGLAFDPDGTKMYAIGNTNDTVYQYDTNGTWTLSSGGGGSSSWDVDISGLTYDNVSFDLSGTVTAPWKIVFKPDGTKFYTNHASNVREWELSTAWDLSTTTYSTVLNTSTHLRGLAFKPDGTELYTTHYSASTFKQYTLSTAWDLSTATLTTSKSVGSPGGDPVGITFKPDGTIAYIVDWKNGQSAYVYQWSLSTAWDASTLSYANKSINLHSQEPIAYEVRFNPNGTKMYAIGFTNDEIHQYSLSTAYDISTATYDTKKFDVSSQETLPLGFAFKPDGTKLYLASNTNDVIYQYSTGYTPPASGGSNVQAFFAAAQYTGTGTSAAATQDITTDVDLSSGTGMVMTKRTDGTASWFMTDTVRGGSKEFPVTSAAEGNTGLISSFNSDGYTLTGYGNTNTNVHEYLSYTFKKQDHFINCFQYVGNGTTQQIAHGLSSTPGLILVKRSGYHWGYWHKEFTGTSNGSYFNINSAPAARLTWFNDNTNVVDPTSTHFTVGSSGQVNGNGATYTAYVFGDNINGSGGFGSSGSEDIIKCGTYTGTGTTDGEEIDLGFQPQLFFFKNVTNSNLWHVFDAERGLTDVVSTNDPYLSFDNSNGEASSSNIVRLITDGIKIVGSNHPRWNSLNDKYIYVAIRADM